MDLNPFPPVDWTSAGGPYELASHAYATSTNVLVLLNAWLDSGNDPTGVHDWQTLNYWAARLRPLWDVDTPPDDNTSNESPPETSSTPTKQTLVVVCNRTGIENGTRSSVPFSLRPLASDRSPSVRQDFCWHVRPLPPRTWLWCTAVAKDDGSARGRSPALAGLGRHKI